MKILYGDHYALTLPVVDPLSDPLILLYLMGFGAFSGTTLGLLGPLPFFSAFLSSYFYYRNISMS